VGTNSQPEAHWLKPNPAAVIGRNPFILIRLIAVSDQFQLTGFVGFDSGVGDDVKRDLRRMIKVDLGLDVVFARFGLSRQNS
jgi:hypothetical protein